MSTLVQNGGLPSLTEVSNSQWMEIQRNTFKNWVNEQLKGKGQSIFDLRTDFADGVLLVELVEVLQRKKLEGVVHKPAHNHEKLHNITLALDAIAKDNVTLINIDSTHITEGNTKLLLALMWQLVLRYQIGLSNFHNRSWLLAWVQAVIPECKVTNLTTDWNSGVALSALLEFCKKGLCPDINRLDPHDKVHNCREAMKLARQHFGIPLILRPEDLANSNLDELSAITYLSYFTKVGSPGYNATLQRIQPLVQHYPVANFTTDWNDGRILCELVYVFGGSIFSWPELHGTNIQRLHEGINGASGIGVDKLLSAEDMAEESSEHLGIMAYAARFLRLNPGVVTIHHAYKETKIITMEETRSGSPLLASRTVNHKNKDSSSSSSSSPSSYSRPTTAINESVESVNRQLEYTLVRTPSLRRKQKTRGKINTEPHEITKDTYSDGVIIYTTSHTLVAPDEIKLEAESPTGRLIKMNGDGTYHAQFGADEIGLWKVALYLNEKMVDNCTVNVCDPSQVKVSGLKGGMTNSTHRFQIDCTNAGNGKLEVNVEREGLIVSCYLTERRPKVYNASFTPMQSGHYKVEVCYNNAQIRDDGENIMEELHRQAVFSTKVTPHHDHFKVSASCDWQIDYLTGGPIDVFVGDTANVRVYSMQDGTICNYPHLMADVTSAPPDCTIVAEVTYGGQRFSANVEEDKPGFYRIMFDPRGPGTYKVWITCDGRLIKGSPFLQEIDELTTPKATGPGLTKAAVNEPAEFQIDARGFPDDINVEVKGPHFPINSTVSVNPDNTHKVVYVPEEPGIHRINIKQDGKDVAGSPYHPKVVDPTKIRVSGGWGSLMDNQERIPLQVGKEKHIPFDASEAGPGELTAIVHGPSDKIPTTTDARGDGKHTLIFTPKEEGKHYIEVFWGGFPISRKPFLGVATQPGPEIYITNNNSYPVQIRTEPITRHVEHRRSEPPSGNWVRADRKPDRDDGPHKVYILAPNKSPQVQRSQTIAYPPTRIQVYRHGSDVSHTTPRYYTQPKRMGSAYSGSSVSVKSEPKKSREPDYTIKRLPRVTPIYMYDSQPNSEPYLYHTSPMSSSPPSLSPSYIYAKPQKLSPTSNKGPSPKVILRGRGLKQADINKPATFTIDGTEAGPGGPEASISSIRSEPPVEIVEIAPKQYKCTYTPTVPGAYLLDVKWNKKPLKCCPFKIDVHKPVYPDKVGVTGNNLKTGEIGKDIDLHIDPREAGQGDLTIDCKDPDGKDEPVHLRDNFDGTYRLKVKPTKPGRHTLNVRLNKQHVLGSPYVIDVKGPPPKGDVKVYGPGLDNGVFPEYQGTFYIDATGAGGGELHVSVMGLKGAFNVEMKRASQKDKLFNCLYHPLEPGLYTINVQWSGKHVGGSPYKIFVAGSEMDLLEYESKANRSISSSPRSSEKRSPNTTQNSIMY